MGADYIATGHYVKKSKIKNQKSKIIYKLLVAKDKNKDQSYFLWTLGQKQLKYCLFPIGGYVKPEVRKIAEKNGLPTAKKQDSQGLCFVGEFKLEEFLKKKLKPRPGNILNEKGEKIGTHEGTQYYTIGQRKGTGAQGDKPLYIVEKNKKNNTITVADKFSETKYAVKEITAEKTNWITGVKPGISAIYSARIRYRQPLQKCRLKVLKNGNFKVIFRKPQRAATPGQSIVIYSRQGLVGGGIIK
jgi:tRNA-specific 2-thiouridylase